MPRIPKTLPAQLRQYYRTAPRPASSYGDDVFNFAADRLGRRNGMVDDYGNIVFRKPLPMPESYEPRPVEYDMMPEETQRPYRMPRFPVDRIPSAGPEDGLDYGRPYRSLRRRTYPEYRTMEFRYGRDDVNPPRLDDDVFRPSDPRYRNVRLTPMGDFGYDDVEF